MNTQEILKPIEADFEKFLVETYGDWHVHVTERSYMNMSNHVLFYDFPLDFQLGVLLRYFRERWGIEIAYEPFNINDYRFCLWLKRDIECTIVEHDFNIAFEQALTKAVELVKGAGE